MSSKKFSKLKPVISVAKYAIPALIVAWLLWTVPEEDYQRLKQRPKDWGLLAVAGGIVLSAVSLTFVRWYLLVRALRLRFRLLDAFRLGFLGYLLNFVSVGAVGGDLFKAVFIAREQEGRRAEAVATVLVDRITGLFGLLLLTSGAILFGTPVDPTPEVVAIGRVTLLATVICCSGLAVLLLPVFRNGYVSAKLVGIPRIGPILTQLISALSAYRRRWLTLLLAVGISIGSHTLFVLSMYVIAHAMFEHVPDFREHMIIVPLGMVAGALPFTPAGLGAFEFAIAKLYKMIPSTADCDVSGVLVALAYRLMTIAVAMVGVVVYWCSRREVLEVMEDARHEL